MNKRLIFSLLALLLILTAGVAAAGSKPTADEAVLLERWQTLDRLNQAMQKPYRESQAAKLLEVGPWRLAGLEAVASDTGPVGRSYLTIYFHAGERWLKVGGFFIAGRALVEEAPGGKRIRMVFPHDRFNLSSGPKLQPGFWTGTQVITVTPDRIVNEYDLTALAASGDMNVSLPYFDADRFDEAYLYTAAEGRHQVNLLDLGLESGLKEVPARRRPPAWLALVSREGMGIKLSWRHQVEGARVVDDPGSPGRTYLRLAGPRFVVDAGRFSGSFGLLDIQAGARVRVVSVMEGHYERDRRVVPPNRVYPPLDWRQARAFDSHGHFDQSMPMDDLIRVLRKNRIIFGVTSIEYLEGAGHRAFLGDQPVLEAMRRAPDVIVGFGFVRLNPTGSYPNCPAAGRSGAADVERLKRLGFPGLKAIEKWSPANYDDPANDPVYAAAARLRMPIVFHAGFDWSNNCSASRLAEVARRHPDLPAVAIAHGSEAADFDKLVEALRKTPNLYQQHMHYGSVADLKRFREAGLAAKLVFATDNQTEATGEAAAAAGLIRNLRQAGYTEPEIEFIMVGYAAGWLNEPRLRRSAAAGK